MKSTDLKETKSSRNLPGAFLSLLILVLAFNSRLIAPYALVLVLGWIFATVLRPLERWLRRRLRRPRLSAFAVTLLATLTIILPVAGFGFLTARNVVRAVSPYVNSGVGVDSWLSRAEEIPSVRWFFDDPEDFRAFAEENGKKLMVSVSHGATGAIAALPGIALQLTLSLLTCFFLLLEGDRLRKWASERIPLDPETQSDLSRKLNDIAYSSFLSMFFAALAQSGVVFLGFLVLKVPFAMLALGLAFLFAWIPIFGVTPVWAAAVVGLFLSGRSGAAFAMIGFGLVAGVVDNIVRPWVIRGRSDLHPLVSLVAIFGAIELFGILGVLVGPISAACAIEFLKLWPPFSARLGVSPGSRT